MNTLTDSKKKPTHELNPFLFVNFTKASPQAIDRILNALNAEMDQALAQNRPPTLEGAFDRLGFSNSIMM